MLEKATLGPVRCMRLNAARSCACRAMQQRGQHTDAACQHVLLFAALLDHSSLEVAATAFVALAASLQTDVNRQRDELLLELAPQLKAALQRPGLVAEAAAAKLGAAETIALHAFKPLAAARLQLADASICASEVQQLGQALAAAAVPTAQHVLSADSAAVLGHDCAPGFHLLAAAMLLDGAATSSGSHKAPLPEVLRVVRSLPWPWHVQLVVPGHQHRDLSSACQQQGGSAAV